MTYMVYVMRWDDGYIFKLTLLACVNFTPHKPYIPGRILLRMYPNLVVLQQEKANETRVKNCVIVVSFSLLPWIPNHLVIRGNSDLLHYV